MRAELHRQGVVTAAELLSVAAFIDGHEAQAFPSFGSERMGAPVMSFCRIDDEAIRVREPVTSPDAVVVVVPDESKSRTMKPDWAINARVVGGLVSAPIIAVPTSVGYGASFNGIAALLTMLNSCAPGVSVVNIDNGFGAGYIAGLINLGKTGNNGGENEH